MALLRVDWNPSDKKVRQFGGLLLIFVLLAAGMAWRTGNIAAAWRDGGVGSLLAFACAAWPAFGRRVYLAWTAVAFLIGTVVSTILLFVLYYAVVTPIGLLFRCMGRDALALRGQADTYWVTLRIPEDCDYFERLH